MNPEWWFLVSARHTVYTVPSVDGSAAALYLLNVVLSNDHSNVEAMCLVAVHARVHAYDTPCTIVDTRQ